jgi:hypothetical protein
MRNLRKTQLMAGFTDFTNVTMPFRLAKLPSDLHHLSSSVWMLTKNTIIVSLSKINLHF